jgi:hypothetical protein
LFAKGLLQEKKLFLYLTSLCLALMSRQWVLCVWKCSLMSTTQLVRLSLPTAMWVRIFLSKSFQFLTSKAIFNCKLSGTSIGCENLFLGFCFFIFIQTKSSSIITL